MKKYFLLTMLITSTILFSACGSSNTNSKDVEELQSQIEELQKENDKLRENDKDDTNGTNKDTQTEEQENTNSQESVSSAINESTAETWGVCGADLTWFYENGTLVIRGTGDMTVFDFEFFSGRITSTSLPWYELKEKIQWVIIENGCTSISEYAFINCSTLSKIELPNSINTIEHGAFNNCVNLTKINIPDSVATIGDGAFYGCTNLTEINIPDSVVTIGDEAFCYCDNLNITFSDTIIIPFRVNQRANSYSVDPVGYVEGVPYYSNEEYLYAHEEYELTSEERDMARRERAQNIFLGDYNIASITWRGTTYNSRDEFDTAYKEAIGIDNIIMYEK